MSDYPRPPGCCGKCPEIVGGGYDCTCKNNPRCINTPIREKIIQALSISEVHHPDHCDCGQPLCGGTCEAGGEDCYCEEERCDGLENQADAVMPFIHEYARKAWEQGHAAGVDYQYNNDVHNPEVNNPY